MKQTRTHKSLLIVGLVTILGLTLTQGMRHSGGLGDAPQKKGSLFSQLASRQLGDHHHHKVLTQSRQEIAAATTDVPVTTTEPAPAEVEKGNQPAEPTDKVEEAVHAITEELAKGPSATEAAPTAAVEAAPTIALQAAPEAPTTTVEAAPEHLEAQNTEKVEGGLKDSVTTEQAVIPQQVTETPAASSEVEKAPAAPAKAAVDFGDEDDDDDSDAVVDFGTPQKEEVTTEPELDAAATETQASKDETNQSLESGLDLETEAAEEAGPVSKVEAPVASVESGAKDLLNEVLQGSGGSHLESLLPDYPEINKAINLDREVYSVEKGTDSIKEQIMRDHADLEHLFNDYDKLNGLNPTTQTSSNNIEANLEDDVDALLESKFFQSDLLEGGSVKEMQSEPALETPATVDDDESLYTYQLESGRKAEDILDEHAAAPSTETAPQEEAKPAVEATEGAKVESHLEVAEPEKEPDTYVAPEGSTGVEAGQTLPTPEPTLTEPVALETQGGFLTGGDTQSTA